MNDSKKTNAPSESGALGAPSAPLIFLSHDTRDHELAEAFSKLLKSVSAGMIKTFRSSDRKGKEGIDFGEEWYKRLMEMLQSTSDVVCLFTERSLDRPWILYEAGVAKGKLNTPVIGIALGVSLSRVATGPFYQFQNMDDSETDLTKLVHQLAKRVHNLELDDDVVRTQVASFKKTETEILNKIGQQKPKKETREESEDGVVAKLAEEMKALPARVAERLQESGEIPPRRKFRRFHPMMLEEMFHFMDDPADPVGILMAASMIRDDAPWMYELAMEVYRAAKSGDPALMKTEMKRLRNFGEFISRGPLLEEFGLASKDSHFFLREFPHILERFLKRASIGKAARTGLLAKDPV